MTDRIELDLYRHPTIEHATLGELYLDSVFECFTLEDEVRELFMPTGELVEVSVWKVAGQTAIPSGRYQIVLDMSPRFQRLMPHLLNVPGFSGVRIHSGNRAEDTEGCILVGTGVDQDQLTGSALAYERLFQKLKAAETITLAIHPATTEILLA